MKHETRTPRKNGNIIELQIVKLEAAQKSFYFMGAKLFNALASVIREINETIQFKKTLR